MERDSLRNCIDSTAEEDGTKRLGKGRLRIWQQSYKLVKRKLRRVRSQEKGMKALWRATKRAYECVVQEKSLVILEREKRLREEAEN